MFSKAFLIFVVTVSKIGLTVFWNQDTTVLMVDLMPSQMVFTRPTGGRHRT